MTECFDVTLILRMLAEDFIRSLLFTDHQKLIIVIKAAAFEH